MRLTNSSDYPTEEVAALVAFAMKGVKTTRLAVKVKNCSGAYGGMAYEGVPRISTAYKLRSVDRLVTVRIGKPSWFPSSNMSPGATHPYGGKRSPLIEHRNWREALVAVAAHEARHIWQYQHNKSRSEVDAERFAAKRLSAYRDQLEAKEAAAHAKPTGLGYTIEIGEPMPNPVPGEPCDDPPTYEESLIDAGRGHLLG